MTLTNPIKDWDFLMRTPDNSQLGPVLSTRNSHDAQMSPPLRPTLMSLNIPTSYSWSISFATEISGSSILRIVIWQFCFISYNLYSLYLYNSLHIPIRAYRTTPLNSIPKWLSHRQTPTIIKERSLSSLVCKTLTYTVAIVQTLQFQPQSPKLIPPRL